MVVHRKGPPSYTASELEQLVKLKLRQYERERQPSEAKQLQKEIIKLMRQLADTHPEPCERKRWEEQADNLDNATEEEREHILLDIGKGLGLILVLPFLFAGGVLYGVGLFVKGVGNLLTGGAIKKAFE
ncbi:MFS general substrate transporter [Mycena indigotica]|uniref:MFS general substrate transporter n=1 Tax=Mycena indigotica TaxID=2126181 RepID=A0A8H6SVM7_9AGAR|nr:MFS general substrate transporter [Mycena indigotica]KAF7306214.1 MFS general substrate transporter [Mycena indigotica]